MPHVLPHILETTQTTGTGTLDLDGPVTGFEPFSQRADDGGRYEYLIESADKQQYERGIGTFLAGAPHRLSRDIVRTSSSGDAKISLESETDYTVTSVIPAAGANAATVSVTATGSINLDRRNMTEFVNASSGAVTRTLPLAVQAMSGFRVTVVKTDASENAVTIARAGSDTISGETSTSLATQWQAATLVSDGVSAWRVVAIALGAQLLDDRYLRRANNLNDVADVPATRTNLGLGSMALVNTPFVGSTHLQDQTVTLGKIQALNGARVLGRTNTSSGAPHELAVDGSMLISGTTLSVNFGGIARNRLKTSTATTSVAVPAGSTADLSFSAYAFFPNIRLNAGGVVPAEMFIHPHASTFGSLPDASGFLLRNTGGNPETVNIHHRFVAD